MNLFQRRLSQGGPVYRWPLVGESLSLRRDPLIYFSDLALSQGDIAKVDLGLLQGFLISTPELASKVLIQRTDKYGFPDPYKKFSEVIGTGLTATPDGPEWRKKRVMFQGFFGRRALEHFAEEFALCARETSAAWTETAKAGLPIDLRGEMMRYTQKCLFRCLFGMEFRETAAFDTFRDISDIISGRFWSATNLIPFYSRMPFPENLRLKQAMSELDFAIYEMIEEKRSSGEGGNDFLSKLVHAVDPETGERFSDVSIRDEILTFLLAGYETTSCLLAWTFILLSQNPQAKDAVQAETIAAQSQTLGAVESLSSLTFTNAVVQESLRLYPPAWMILRQAKQDDILEGTSIKEGALLFISPYVVQRNPKVWDKPATFDPGRFRKDLVQQRHALAMCPFGHGPRHCIGNYFAIYEAIALLKEICASFDFSVVGDQEIGTDPLVVLHPKGTVNLLLNPLH